MELRIPDWAKDRPGIYKITCTANGCVYIGQAVRLGERLRRHERRKDSNFHLTNHRDFYGEEHFVAEVVLVCEEADLTSYERAILANHGGWQSDRTYNDVDGGRSPMSTPWGRERQRAGLRAALATPEAKARKSAVMKTRYADPDARVRASVAQKTRYADPDARERTAEAIRAACADPEVRAKMSAGQKARYVDPEKRARHSAVMQEWWARRRAAQAGQ